MKLIACLQLLSVVGSIDAAGIADDNKGRVSSVRELQAVEPDGTILDFVDGTPEEPLLPPRVEDGEGLDDIPTTIKKINFFTTLVAALGAANLVPALSGAGPFTVFAPTDDAFAALPAALVPCLLLPENKAVLTSILMYHVLSFHLAASDLPDGQVISTLFEGQDFTVHRLVISTLLDGQDVTVTIMGDGTVMINEAHMVLPDIKTTNGVVHAMDTVLVPASVDVAAFLATCPAVDKEASADASADTESTPEEPPQPTPAQLCGGK